MIVSALRGRLISEAAFARNPGHVDVAIERPIFMCGLTRTGTTALHRLLSADPANQGVEMWLAEAPQPRPARETWSENPDFLRCDAFYRARQANEADLMKVHFMGAEEVEECWRLLQQTMLSTSFDTIAYVPSYTEWLAKQDWTDTYARYKKNLQLIGMNDRDRRWVLKSPSHVFAIDDILKVFPDALFVRTFRDPHTSMASTFSLAEQGGHGMSKAFDRKTIGRTQLDLWARGNANFQEARARHNPSSSSTSTTGTSWPIRSGRPRRSTPSSRCRSPTRRAGRSRMPTRPASPTTAVRRTSTRSKTSESPLLRSTPSSLPSDPPPG